MRTSNTQQSTSNVEARRREEPDEETIRDLGPASDLGDGSAIAALNRSEIDMQISTARKYPRSIARSKQNMIDMATIDEETAKGCGYALKRVDRKGVISWIEGPSIRMAEIAVSCWGNLRYGARIVSEDDRFITAQGVCHDLETNVSNTMEVRRRITNRDGKKYGDDMIGVTANAASAIAARNAVFKVVPMVIVRSAYAQAMKVAGGDEKTFGDRRKAAIQAFQALGVKTEEVCEVVGKKGIEDLDTVDLRRLLGLYTAIKDGETTVEQVFHPAKAGAEPSADTAKLNEVLKSKKKPETAKEEKATEQSAAPAPVAETKPEPAKETKPAENAKESDAAAIDDDPDAPAPTVYVDFLRRATAYCDIHGIPDEHFTGGLDNAMRMTKMTEGEKIPPAMIALWWQMLKENRGYFEIHPSKQ